MTTQTPTRTARNMKTIARLALLVTLLAAIPAPMAQVNTEEAAVRKFVLEEIERWNSNGPLIAERYAADSDYVDVNGAWTRGLADRKNKRDNPRLKDSRATLVDLHIRFIRPDVAIVHQTHDMSGKRGANGEELPTERQLSTRVLVKERGKWVQTAFQNTIVRPVEPGSK
jgi:uncharacterized protein (TIGR02246 family)